MKSRTSDKVAQRTATETPWWRRGWAIVSGAILAAGALASAITAVIGLVSSPPDLVDRAEITFVDLIPSVPLSQYEERTGGGPQSLGQRPDLTLAAYGGSLTTTGAPELVNGETPEESPGQEPTGTTSASPSGSPGESPTAGPSESPASPSPTSGSPSESPEGSPTGSPTASPSGLVTEPPFAYPLREFRYKEVLAEVAELDPRLELPPAPGDGDPSYVLNLTIDAVDEEGEPLPPAEAARRLVQVFGETRTRTTPQGTLDPLGVVVTANVELTGLRGRELGVFWEVWSQDGGTQLYDKWLDQVPVSRITAQRDTDAGSVRFWVPMPKDPGEYVIDVIVRDGDATLDTRPTRPFS